MLFTFLICCNGRTTLLENSLLSIHRRQKYRTKLNKKYTTYINRIKLIYIFVSVTGVKHIFSTLNSSFWFHCISFHRPISLSFYLISSCFHLFGCPDNNRSTCLWGFDGIFLIMANYFLNLITNLHYLNLRVLVLLSQPIDRSFVLLKQPYLWRQSSTKMNEPWLLNLWAP